MERQRLSFLARLASLRQSAKIAPPTAHSGRLAVTLLMMLLTTASAWATITGSGSSTNPYVINNDADYETFATTTSYWASGVYVKLAADVSTTKMVGTSSNKYMGTFNGDGHTLTFNATATVEGCAPFGYIDGAIIKCLKVAGTISTSHKYAAGFAYQSFGNCTIQNCQSSIAINTSISDDGTHAGFVAVHQNGTLTFNNCLFDGSITGDNTTNCGGFVGWRNGTLIFNNCLMAGTMAINQTNGSALFYRNDGGSTLTYCYYDGNKSYGSIATQDATSTTATGSDPQTQLGSGWQVSGNSVVPKIDYYDLCLATVDISSFYHYTGSEIAVRYTVIALDGIQLTTNDYEVTSLTRDGVSTATVQEQGNYFLTLTGKGDYHGTISTSFTVGSNLLIGSTTDNIYCNLPFIANNNYSLSQQIYTQAELGATGEITSISFFMNNTGSTSLGNNNFDIYMVHTKKSEFTSNTDWITVTADDRVHHYDSDKSIWFADGNGFTKTTITLDKPFIYNGTDNLAVIFDNNRNKTNNAYDYHFYRVDCGENSSISVGGDSNYDPLNIGAAEGECRNFKSVIELGFSKKDVTKFISSASISGIQEFYQLNNSDPVNITYTVTDVNGNTLNSPTDYTAVIKNSADETVSTITATGRYTLTITGAGDYSGSQSIVFTVVPAAPAGMSVDESIKYPNTGFYYVNMPQQNTADAPLTVSIPDNIQSFKVYDNGGKDGNYSDNCDGYLVLTAPEGYKLKLTGTVAVSGDDYSSDYLAVYEGTTADDTRLLKKNTIKNNGSIGTLYGSSLLLYFYSNSIYENTGLNLTVEMLQPVYHNINGTGDVTNGNITANKTSAYDGEAITLDITPANGYVLTGVTVSDGENNLPISGGTWYDTSVAFTMPDKAVTVSATFTDIATAQAAGLSINMSSEWNSRTYATIPIGVTAFSIYDAAGPNATTEDLGTALTVTLEDDMAMRVTGSISLTDGYCNIYGGSQKIFDGNNSNNNISCETPGNVLLISASSDNTDVALNVEVISPYHVLTATEINTDYFDITFTGDGVINEGGTYKAKAGSNVTIVMTPKDGNYHPVYNVKAFKQGDESVKYDVNWYGFLCQTATFTMPINAVGVKVDGSHSSESNWNPGLMIPKRGMVEVNVPSSANLEKLHVYDFGGRDGNISGSYGFSDSDDGTLLLTAPAGKTFQLSSSSYINAPAAKYLIIYNADNNQDIGSLMANTTSLDEATQTYAKTDKILCQRIKINFYSYAVSGTENPYEGVHLSLHIIDIPALTLNDASANDLSDKKNKTYNVTLSGRTLTKDGNWNTLCLPFAVTAAQMAETTHPLYGATIKELDAANTSLNTSTGALTLAFTDATSIEAGKPYIVKWFVGDNISNPVFPSVTITSTTPTEVESDDKNVKFVGQYSPFAIDDNNINSILYVASGNQIGYSKSARTLKSCRAHFWVKPNENGGAGARSFVLDFGDNEVATGILTTNLTIFTNSDGAWYTLDGRKLDKQPTKKGVYIHNGRKTVIK